MVDQERITVSKAYITKQVKKWYELDPYIMRWALAKWEAIAIVLDGIDELTGRLMQNSVGFNGYHLQEIIDDLCQEFEGEGYGSWNKFVEHVEGEFK